jgi:hypothetical protein
MMTLRRLAIILVLTAACIGWALPAAAQEDDGQFCMRAFEDRNGNGQRDPGEPLITRGVGAELLDSQGAIIASALLDNSPTGAQGVICFQNLAPGQYTMNVTSAEFAATGGDNMTVNITGSGLPTVFEFGGQRPEGDTAAVTTTTDTAADRDEAVMRIVVSVLGGGAAIVLMLLLGALIYVLFYRQRPQPTLTTDTGEFKRRTTGSMPVVPPTDTGQFRRPTIPPDDE